MTNALFGGTYTTAFAVIKTPSSWNAGNSYTLFGSSTAGQFQWRLNGGSNVQQILQESNTLVIAGTVAMTATNTWHQLNFNGRVAGGSAATLRIDRTADQSVAFNGVTGTNRLFTNGASGGEFGAGLSIAELFIYGGVSTSGLTSDEIKYDECYIYGKDGI